MKQFRRERVVVVHRGGRKPLVRFVKRDEKSISLSLGAPGNTRDMVRESAFHPSAARISSRRYVAWDFKTLGANEPPIGRATRRDASEVTFKICLISEQIVVNPRNLVSPTSTEVTLEPGQSMARSIEAYCRSVADSSFSLGPSAANKAAYASARSESST